jgi:hypothetical protein
MNNTLKMNKFNTFGGSKKNKGGMGRGRGESGRGRGESGRGRGESGRGESGRGFEKGVITSVSERTSGEKSPREEQLSLPKSKKPSIEFSSDAYRTISVVPTSLAEKVNVIEKLLEGNNLNLNATCPKQDGTPGKRLLFLAILCKQILIKYKKVQEKTFNQTYGGLISFMSGISDDTTEFEQGDNSRGWWGGIKNIELKNSLLDLVRETIKYLETSKNGKEFEIENICALMLNILVKSDSDVGQEVDIINSIPNLPGFGQLSSSTQTVFDKINKDSKVVFVSSDKICAGVSSLIIDELAFPFEVLCTRKSSYGSKNIQNIIVQKGIIASLAVCLNLLETAITPEEVLEIFPEDKRMIAKNMLISILFYFSSYQKTLNVPIETQIELLYKIKKSKRDTRIYQTEGFKNLSQFIEGISNVLQDKQQLIDTPGNKTVIQDKRNLDLFIDLRDNLFIMNSKFRCNTWCYNIAMDVFRVLNPQNETDWETLKSNISKKEFLAATIDGTYGHDFAGLDCIQELGIKFMNIVGFKDYLLPPDLKHEDDAIRNCLAKSKCVTIDQIEDSLIFNFDTTNNYLISQTNLGNPKNWHFFESLFSLKPLYLAIDFKVGVQPYVPVSSKQIVIVEQSRNVAPNPINSNEIQEIAFQQIKENGSGFEFMGPCALFDGAASYGILPYYPETNGKLNSYESKYIFEYKYIVKDKKNEIPESFNIELSINTFSNLDINALKNTYMNSLIPSINNPIELIYDSIIEKHQELNRIYIIDKLNNTNSEFEIKFKTLWGSFLDSKIKKGRIKLDKQDYTDFIKGCMVYFSKYKKIGVPDYLKDIYEQAKNVKSNSSLQIFIQVFYSIIGEIIYKLINGQLTEDEKQELINLLTSGVSQNFKEVVGNESYDGPISNPPTNISEINEINDSSKLSDVFDIFFYNLKKQQDETATTPESGVAAGRTQSAPGNIGQNIPDINRYGNITPPPITNLASIINSNESIPKTNPNSNKTISGPIFPSSIENSPAKSEKSVESDDSEEFQQSQEIEIGTPYNNPNVNTNEFNIQKIPLPVSTFPVSTVRESKGMRENIGTQSTDTSPEKTYLSQSNIETQPNEPMDTTEGGNKKVKQMKKTRKQRSKKNKRTKRRY